MSSTDQKIAPFISKADKWLTLQRLPEQAASEMLGRPCECRYQNLTLEFIQNVCAWQDEDQDKAESLNVEHWRRFYPIACLEAIGVAPKAQRGLASLVEPNISLRFGQYLEYWKNGVIQKPIGACYHGYFNPTESLICVTRSENPREKKAQSSIKAPEETLPDIQHWSEVAFAIWKHLCIASKTRVRVPRYVLFTNVSNDEILKLIWRIHHDCKPSFDREILSWRGDRLLPGPWPGETFTADDRRGKMLLATKQGADLSWFLISHKKTFGFTCVKSITMFEGGKRLQLLFEIEELCPSS